MSDLNTWTSRFKKIYRMAQDKYAGGARSPKDVLTRKQTDYLMANGIRAVNIYDYVEDASGSGEPNYETALLLASKRREHFLFHQKGQWASERIVNDDLPPKKEAFKGIKWLPRIIPKAKGFLEGSICEEIMYCCGGDRNFLKSHGVSPPDFLEIVRMLNGDIGKIAKYLRSENS